MTSNSQAGSTLERGKRALRRVLTQRHVSRAVTAGVKPLAGRLPTNLLLRVPVTRIVELPSPLGQGSVLMDAHGTDPIASMLYWRGLAAWEPETLSVFLQLVQPGTTLLDVGANTGFFSLLAARHSPTTMVHAVEPIPRVFGMLQANVALNALTNVACHRLALSDARGRVPMYVPDDDVPLMGSLLPEWRPDSKRIDVDACTVDEFVAANDITDLEIMKVDTEGTEDAVLDGASTTLATQQPFVICEVLAYGRTADRLAEQLDHAGYDFYLLDKDGPRATDSVVGNAIGACPNYLFVPRSRLRRARTLLGL